MVTELSEITLLPVVAACPECRDCNDGSIIPSKVLLVEILKVVAACPECRNKDDSISASEVIYTLCKANLHVYVPDDTWKDLVEIISGLAVDACTVKSHVALGDFYFSDGGKVRANILEDAKIRTDTTDIHQLVRALIYSKKPKRINYVLRK